MRGLVVLLSARPVEEGNVIRAQIAAEICYELLDRIDPADEPATVLRLARCGLTY
jgi:hypothetical protein